jgi:uncharacterized protein with PIN domain
MFQSAGVRATERERYVPFTPQESSVIRVALVSVEVIRCPRCGGILAPHSPRAGHQLSTDKMLRCNPCARVYIVPGR